MFTVNTVARTVRVNELQVSSGVSADGKPFERKSIYFTVASDRNYKMKDGTRKADFLFCKANGELAQIISDYASEKKEDGTIVSRQLYLQGTLETYQSKRDVDATLNAVIAGTTYKVSGKVPVTQDQTIFHVSHLQFLDYKESTKVASTSTTATATTTVEVVAADAAPNGTTTGTSTAVAGITTPPANTAVAGTVPGNTAGQSASASEGVVVGDISAPEMNSYDNINSPVTAPF